MQVKSAEPKCSRLRWLDVADEYLCENRAKLKPRLNFDGTHMSPVFLEYIDVALQQLTRAQAGE